uniref:Uncharacterized protein n=1 Tax=Arundo donax TaxID=35708 RepID=A0A0A9HEU8_ARUDO
MSKWLNLLLAMFYNWIQMILQFIFFSQMYMLNQGNGLMFQGQEG